jgi:membrane dipeptidase
MALVGDISMSNLRATPAITSHAEAHRVIEDAPLVADMVFIYEPEIGNDWRLFERYRQSGFSFIQGHPAGEHTVGEAIKRIARMRRDIITRNDIAVLVETADDMIRAKRERKLGVGLQLESFTCLERSIEMVEIYYQLGVRLCHPIWNSPNLIGGGCADGSDTTGLSQFGKRVIREMNRLGMLIDGSHAGRRSQLDMFDQSSAPVMMTHHGAEAIRPHVRNLSDDLMKRCAATGGIVGITGGGFYLGGMPNAPLLFRHLDHVVQLIGADHVGLGIDYLEAADDLVTYMPAHPDEFPGLADGAWEPVAFAPPEILPELVSLMLGAGYGAANVHAILGGNWLRVCSEVWK